MAFLESHARAIEKPYSIHGRFGQIPTCAHPDELIGSTRVPGHLRTMYLLDLPPEMNDPYWDERAFSCLRSSRTRRALFADRFNLSNVQHTEKRG